MAGEGTGWNWLFRAFRAGPFRGEFNCTFEAMRFWLLDKIRSFEPDVELAAVKNVTLTEEYLGDHFPEFPVLPGVFMLEAATQAGAWLLRLRYGQSFRLVATARPPLAWRLLA